MCVASVRDGGELLDAFASAHIPTMSATRSFFGALRQGLRLWQYARVHEQLVIHSHVFSADVFAYLLTFVTRRVRWVSTQHNVAREYRYFRRHILTWVLRRADRVIAVSSLVEKSCDRSFRVSSDRLLLIENGIPLSPWLAVSPLPQMKRPLQLATIGRLSTQKGHLVLFEALAQLEKQDWKLHLFGDGPLHNALAIKAEHFGIAERIVWHGVLPNIPKELGSIDVVIQPSLWEGRSLVMMETMAAERVVVATTPAAQDLLTDDTGYVVPPDDPDALANVLHHVFANPSDAVDRANEARAYAAAHFDEQDSLDAIDELYDALVG